jgi:hypothetical protein
MNSNNKAATALSIMLAAGLLAGCASGPDRVADDFGNSVRAMNRAQILDPVAANNPDMTPVDGTDGARMENALKTYREDVAKPEQTRRDVVISIGE